MKIRAGDAALGKSGNQHILFIYNINIGRGINIAGGDIQGGIALQIGNKIKGNITVFVGLRNLRFALFVKGQLSAFR